MYLSSHECVRGKQPSPSMTRSLFYFLVIYFFLTYMCTREGSVYFNSRAVVMKGYELLLLAIWEMLLVPQMTKPKLAYLFFLIKTHFWCFIVVVA